MIHVDHDPVAARAAALRCRDAAGTLRSLAARVAAAPDHTAWWGTGRDRATAAARRLAAELRAEAAELEHSADLLDASSRAAQHREAELAAAARAAARAEARVAATTSCTPTAGAR